MTLVSVIANIWLMTNIKKLRRAKKLSIRKLGEIAGVHFVTLARIETEVHDPRLSTLRKLAEALNVSMGRLVGDQSPTKQRRK